MQREEASLLRAQMIGQIGWLRIERRSQRPITTPLRAMATCALRLEQLSAPT
jgi:hypothetical protein